MADLQGQAFSILFRAGDRLCALPLDHVAETMRPQPLQSAAGLPDFVSGVSLIRGAVVPVVDVAVMLGAAPIENAARLIVLRLGARSVALAVSSIVGVRAVGHEAVQHLPPLLREVEGAISAIGSLDRELLLVLQPGRLLEELHMENLHAN